MVQGVTPSQHLFGFILADVELFCVGLGKQAQVQKMQWWLESTRNHPQLAHRLRHFLVSSGKEPFLYTDVQGADNIIALEGWGSWSQPSDAGWFSVQADCEPGAFSSGLARQVTLGLNFCRVPLMLINIRLLYTSAQDCLPQVELELETRSDNDPADQLMNEDLSGSNPELRVNVSLEDLPLQLFSKLLETENRFMSDSVPTALGFKFMHPPRDRRLSGDLYRQLCCRGQRRDTRSPLAGPRLETNSTKEKGRLASFLLQ